MKLSPTNGRGAELRRTTSCGFLTASGKKLDSLAASGEDRRQATTKHHLLVIGWLRQRRVLRVEARRGGPRLRAAGRHRPASRRIASRRGARDAVSRDVCMKTSFLSAKSGAAKQSLPLDCGSKACLKGVFFYRHRYEVRSRSTMRHDAMRYDTIFTGTGIYSSDSLYGRI